MFFWRVLICCLLFAGLVEAKIPNLQQMDLTEALDFIDALEAGEWDDRLTPFEEIEVTEWLVRLALAGATPDDEGRLRESIYSLLHQEIPDLTFAPMSFCRQYPQFIRCGGLWHCVKKTGRFVADNRTPILIGGAILIGSGGVVVLGLAILDGIRVDNAPPRTYESPPPAPITREREKAAPIAVSTTPAVQEVKDFVATGQILQNPSSPSGRIEAEAIGSYIQQRALQPPNNGAPYAWPTQEVYRPLASVSDRPPSYSNIDLFNMCKISVAEQKGRYEEAANGYTALIQNHPSAPYLYLGQGSAFLQLGRTEEALDAFQQYVERAPTPQNHGVMESFVRGFMITMEPCANVEHRAFQHWQLFKQGAVLGLAQSADGFVHLGKQLITDPIHTFNELGQAVYTLACLMKDMEWKQIVTAIAPQAVHLAENWHQYSDLERAEKLGQVFGEIGGDFIICPNVIAAATKRGLTIAKSLNKIASRIKVIEATFALEQLHALKKRGYPVAVAAERGPILTATRPLEYPNPLEKNFSPLIPESQTAALPFTALEAGQAIVYDESFNVLVMTGTDAEGFAVYAKGPSGPPHTVDIRYTNNVSESIRRNSKPFSGRFVETEIGAKEKYRHNLMVFTGIDPGPKVHAHHVFPQRFRDKFEKIGIQIDRPQNMVWWEGSPHQRASKEYEILWDDFLHANPKKLPTQREVLDFGRELMNTKGIQVNYD